MDLKSAGLTALGWAFAVLFFVVSVGNVVDGGGAWAALIGLVLVALCAPPARKWLFERTRLSLRGWPLAILCFVLVAVQASITGSGAAERQKNEEVAQQKAMAERVAKARADNLAYFEKNKLEVLKDITSKVEMGQVAEALAVVNKYAAVSKDPDLAKAKRIVEYENARAQLKDEDSLPLAKKAAIYKTLADLDPSNAPVVAKAKSLNDELEQQLAAERATREKAEAIARRKQSIESQFSSWDGSHRNVEKAVKASMKNPDSYQHVETRYLDTGKNIIVTTTIRGTNSFGGVVPSTFIAEVDDYGNVLSLQNAR